MGGLGSGAWRLHPRVEETPSINLDEITRGLGPEERRCGSWRGVWCEVEPAVGGSDMSLCLEWSTRGGEHEQRIALVQRHTPTGGLYWVGWCPFGGIPVRRLYLTSDGRAWAGRRTLRLKHASTAESALDRANRRFAKLEARIKARGCVVEQDDIVGRPPRRRRDWIERMRYELGSAHERAEDEWLCEVGRILGFA